MAILESVKKLASKVGAETNGRTIAEQINNINRHLDSTGSRDIAEAVSKFADVESGGSGESFTRMAIRHAVIDNNGSPRNISLLFINNDSSSVDVSELSAQTILVLNPVDELKVKQLSVGSSYSVTFVPTANCKVYEGDTELDLNDIFQPEQTPIGPTTYDPDGIKAHFIRGEKSPYSGVSRKLYDSQEDLDVTIS